MIKKRFEIELFYELNENAKVRTDDPMQIDGQEACDLESTIDNCSNIAFRYFKRIKSDYDTTIGHTMQQIYLLESKFAPDYSIECEFAMKLSEMDASARSRLEQLGYDESKREIYLHRSRWKFCCSFFENEILYHTGDIMHFDDIVKT